MLVEGLAGCEADGAAELAEDLALRWLRSNHRGWARDGVMREKYDATVLSGKRVRRRVRRGNMDNFGLVVPSMSVRTFADLDAAFVTMLGPS